MGREPSPLVVGKIKPWVNGNGGVVVTLSLAIETEVDIASDKGPKEVLMGSSESENVDDGVCGTVAGADVLRYRRASARCSIPNLALASGTQRLDFSTYLVLRRHYG